VGFPGLEVSPALIWKEGESPGGFEGELTVALFQRLNCPLKLASSDSTVNPIEQRFAALERGEADFSLYQISITEDRRRRVAFSSPTTIDGAALLVSSETPWRRLADVPVGTLIVNPGTSGAQWAETELPGAWIIRDSSTVADLWQCLSGGECTAFVNDKTALLSIAEQVPGLRVLEDGPYTREEWAIAIRPDHPDLVERINLALDSMEQDGSLPALREKWGFPSP